MQRISENQQISSTWTPSFYGYDGHGNVRFLTNMAGTVTDTYQYDAFGRIINITGSTANNFKYSGEWLDSNVGLFYLRARYLNPATGRFLSRDPVEGKKCCGLSWNPYIYVKDNPVNAVDPTGRGDTQEEIEVIDLTAIARGAAATALVAQAICDYELSASGLEAVTEPGNIGHVQTVHRTGPCRLMSSVRHIPGIGPDPAPFDPNKEVYEPGTDWSCGGENPDGSFECWAPCPGGGIQKLHFSPAGSDPYHPFQHWDWTDCDGKSWYIWTDGTMTPAD